MQLHLFSPQRTFKLGSEVATVLSGNSVLAELLGKQLDSSSSVAPPREQEFVIQWLDGN